MLSVDLSLGSFVDERMYILLGQQQQQRSHVPPFGNWENEGNVPYTVFFDKARKGRGGGPIRNPNDPEEYPDMFSDNSHSHEPPPSMPMPKDDPQTLKPTPTAHERRRSREDGAFRQPYANSPGHRENPGRRQSGSEYSIDRSPLHRHAKPTGRESPVAEGRSLDGGHGNRGKTRMKPVLRDDAVSLKFLTFYLSNDFLRCLV